MSATAVDASSAPALRVKLRWLLRLQLWDAERLTLAGIPYSRVDALLDRIAMRAVRINSLARRIAHLDRPTAWARRHTEAAL